MVAAAAAGWALERATLGRVACRFDEPPRPPADSTHRWVRARDGGHLHAVERGRGRPLVLVHGITLDSGLWALQLATLADRYRVIAVDQRGHGRSTAGTAGFGLARLGDDLADLLVGLDLRDALVVGQSMGGMAVMELVGEHPDVTADRVGAVMLLSTNGGVVLPGLDADRAAVAARRLEARLTRSGAAALPWWRFGRGDLGWLLLRGGFGTGADPTHVTLTRAMLAHQQPDHALASGIGLLANDQRAHLATFAGLGLPTMVVVGSRDRLTPPAVARRLADAVPHATLHVVPGGGHHLMLERPDELAALVDELAGRSPVDGAALR